MGEIADMMLEGILDEETGEYIGDANLERYGSEAPGFPVSYERAEREGFDDPIERTETVNKHKQTPKLECPECGKKVKVSGISDHWRMKHE